MVANVCSSLEVDRYRKCKLNSHRVVTEEKQEFNVSKKLVTNPIYKANSKYMQLKIG